MRKPRKAKYYIKEDWWDNWWGICQVANNVCIVLVENEQMARLLLDILNELPRNVLYIVTSGNSKERWKKQEEDRAAQIRADIMRDKNKKG